MMRGWRVLGVLCLAACPLACFPGITFAERDAGAGALPDAAVEAGDVRDAGVDAEASVPAREDAEAGPGLLEGNVLTLSMDEGSWVDGGVRDSSGRGNHGTAVGTVTATPAGKRGGGGLFDGAGWISVADATSLHVQGAFSVAAWIRPTALDGALSPGIVSKRRGFEDAVAFTLFVYSSNQLWADIESTRIHSNASMENGVWHHVALVWDGAAPADARARFYVDGALDSVHPTTETSLRVNTQSLLVGELPGGGNRFVGSLDEVGVWSRALSAAEIASVYEAGRAP